MTLVSIFALILSYLYNILIYLLGEMLSNTRQLRLFLGMNTQDENERNFVTTTKIVENIGLVVKIIAIASAITSTVTTIKMIFMH